MAVMTTYWIYENLVAHEAIVHRADCGLCDDGTGPGTLPEVAGRWLPCDGSSESEIRSVPIRPDSKLRKFGITECRKDPALAWL